MKRTILINQQAVVEAGLDLDFIDLVIFDYIKDFAHSDKITKVQLSDGVYFWVSHTKIMEDLPLLNIKTKAGIVKRIERLINAGLLIRSEESVTLQKSVYRFGPAYDLMISTPSSLHPTTEVEGGYKQKLGGPINESLGDNSIKDIFISDNNREEGPQNFTDPLILEGTVSKPMRGTTETLRTFEKSRFYDFNLFSEQFLKDEKYKDADLVYYYERVKNWASSKNIKREDWIATARNFMLGDLKKDGKFVQARKDANVLSPETIAYLQRDKEFDLWPGL